MAQQKIRKNPKRTTRNNNISYDESTPEPQPSLQYSKPRRKTNCSIKSISFPEFHMVDQLYWVPVMYWNDPEIEFYPIREACHKYIGNENKKQISYKKWLLSFKDTKWMTPSLLSVVEEAITVTVTPKYPIGSICMLINESLPSIISYVRIRAINSNNFCHFDDIDDLLLYYVDHIDLRNHKLKKFNKTTGKEFDLDRPSGWVTECGLVLVTNLKYIGMPDIVWMNAQLHYYKLLAESNADQSETVTSLFMATVGTFFDFVSARIRGTLHIRNEGKVKSFTYYLSNGIIDSVLNTKFREIKKLKKNQQFKKEGSSTFYIFNHSQSEVIIPEKYINRDFNIDGKEVFAENICDMTDEDEDEYTPNYTMTVSVLMLRFYRTSQTKMVSTHNIVRLDSENKMHGQNTDFWVKHQSNFDVRDCRHIKAKPANENHN